MSGPNQLFPGPAAPANFSVETSGGGINGQRKKGMYSNTLGRGRWPKDDPLHDPPMTIDSFFQPALGTD